MMMATNKEIPLIVVHGNKSVRWFFQSIMWERMLNNDYKIIISTINKYKPIAEQLITTLKMWGWMLDNSLDKNPYEEVKKGKDTPLTFIKYVLVLNPTIEAIMEEVMKERKSQNILLYHLDNIHNERMKNENIMNDLNNQDKLKQLISLIEDVIEKKNKVK